jgi:hypothetical protein
MDLSNVKFHTSAQLQEALVNGRAFPATLRILRRFTQNEIHIMPDFSPDESGLLPVGLAFATNGVIFAPSSARCWLWVPIA